ncbi:MAG: CDP-diacylglycerol--serine O-phosphatidyltransferase [Flavobacteriales bacterium]|nr:CDP-diacylglycerol--serine O-phosphatidyltransferase [Flavobacteriales bacterium]MCB9167409.1 CDP-diacylglycerol--serine O-phosphatidyltransferase [Flavobacteriales bacterium]
MPRLPRIPDLLTTANLGCGVASILLASQGQLTIACWLVFAGAGFDVLDGLAARALGGGSELGKQLDSLADMVTFGVAPGMLIVLGRPSWETLLPEKATGWAVLAAALVLAIASAWRLARFNIDTRQAQGFLGLPTPANALFWTFSVLLFSPMENYTARADTSVLLRWGARWMGSSAALLATALVLGVLMLSSVAYPSLKFKHFRWQSNEVMYTLLGLGLLLVLFNGTLAAPMILLLYILSPLWGKLFHKTA